MAELKLGESFGLERDALEEIDFDVALVRILNDIKTDFIYAPHINLIFARAQEELKKIVKGELSSGKFMPGLHFYSKFQRLTEFQSRPQSDWRRPTRALEAFYIRRIDYSIRLWPIKLRP